MGSNAKAIICFGVDLKGIHKPWKAQGIEDWWLKTICKYAPPFQVFDDQGHYVTGVKPPNDQIDAYFSHKRNFIKEHPLPVELARYGCDGYEDTIMAVCGSVQSTEWDSSLEIESLTVNEENIKKFEEFRDNYFQIKIEPKWLLSAYFG